MSLGNFSSSDLDDLLETAKSHFKTGHYDIAKPLLEQLAVAPQPKPDVFFMLGTIAFDSGKFNRSIKMYRRSLELDPSFTDAAVGLSVVLNDLGRYEEGKRVFQDAQSILDRRTKAGDPYTNERLAIKHDELGELYFKSKQFEEALAQYELAYSLAPSRLEFKMKAVESLLRLNRMADAQRDLRALVAQRPTFLPARLKLGLCLYQAGLLPEAVEVWEGVLLRDPTHPLAKQYIEMAQKRPVAELD